MSDFEEREAVVLKSQGEKIFGVLHIPRKVMRPPCILVCHGLGGHKTGRYRVYVELAETLSKAGFAVLRFDFRGSGDSEGNFVDMTLQGEVSDALIALHFLQNHPKIDGSRLGIFGRSLGASVAVIAAATFGKIKSTVLWAPIYNGEQWKTLWQQVQSGQATDEQAIEMRRINGQVAGFPFYAELFNMNIPETLKMLKEVPMLIIHGQKDDMVVMEHSTQYLALRNQDNSKTKFISLKEGDHDFTYPPEREYAIQETVKWFLDTV